MRPIRLLATAALGLAALVAGPAEARTPALPELAATTVLTTTGSGYVDVLVPEHARLSPRYDANPDVTFSGTGRLLGVWLEPLDDGQDRLEAVRLPAFLGGRTQTSGSTEPAPVCSSDPLGGQSCTTPTPTAILLHEGRYRLTVLSDGHPVTVTLRLRGLDPGTAELRPAHALASAQQPLPARESLGDKTVTYGGQGPLAGSLRTFVAATAKAPGSQLDGASTCERRDDAATPPYAFLPSCPGGLQSSYRFVVAGGQYGVFGMWFGGAASDTARSSLGGSFTNDAGVALGQTLGVWLRVA